MGTCSSLIQLGKAMLLSMLLLSRSATELYETAKPLKKTATLALRSRSGSRATVKSWTHPHLSSHSRRFETGRVVLVEGSMATSTLPTL